jgi:hypothetical protein
MTTIRYHRLMRATLTLDDDVTALLDLARQEQGRSLEEVASLEAKIDQLYNELGALKARSAKDPGVEIDIAQKREQLQALQVEEAAAWRSRVEAHRHLKPGEGRQILERAEQLLDR